MTRSPTVSSACWRALNIVAIVMSAIGLLYVPARTNGLFAMAFGLLLAPVYFVGLILRLKTEGTADLTVTGLHQQARSGRGLKLDPLELAATVAMVLAAISLQ